MQNLIIIAIICGSALLAWHMWLTTKYARPYYTNCACGHTAAFHKDEGGCKYRHDGSTDIYGFCTCLRTVSQVDDRIVNMRFDNRSL